MKFPLPNLSGGAGRVPVPKNTVPQFALAGMFARLAAMRGRGKPMVNAPDPADARLPRPDAAVMDTRRGRALVRQPVIGVPTPY